jgi:hypothetical protein
MPRKRRIGRKKLRKEVKAFECIMARYLQIERAAEDPSIRTQDTTERSSRQTISTLSSQSSLGVLKKLPARDSVSTTAGWPTRGSLICRCI